MSKAIRIHETGGPEVLRWEEVTIGPPGPGDRVAYAGLPPGAYAEERLIPSPLFCLIVR
jgi:NADPH2:quinone reductase